MQWGDHWATTNTLAMLACSQPNTFLWARKRHFSIVARRGNAILPLVSSRKRPRICARVGHAGHLVVSASTPHQPAVCVEIAGSYGELRQLGTWHSIRMILTLMFWANQSLLVQARIFTLRKKAVL